MKQIEDQIFTYKKVNWKFVSTLKGKLRKTDKSIRFVSAN